MSRKCLMIVSGLLGVVGTEHASGQVAQVAEPTAFEHVSVIPMDRERVLRDQTVLVRGDRIVALGPAARVRVPAGATRIDGRGKFLIPGLGNMHAHLQIFYSPPIDSVLDRPTIERMLLRYLAGGVTTVRNMNGRPWHLTLRRQVARGELLGPRIYTAGPILGLRDDQPLRTPAEAVHAVAAQEAAGYDFLKVYDNDFSAETFDSLIAAQRRSRLPIAGHTPGVVGLERVLQARFVSIEHLYGYQESVMLRDSGVVRWRRGELDEAKLKAAVVATKRAGVWNDPTLAARSLGRGVSKIAKALHDGGAGLLFGTDGDAFMLDGAPVWELEALVAAGLTPYEALETGTRNVAQFFSTLDSTGTIAVGKRADLVLLSGDPLREIWQVGEPAGVMAAGRWLSRADFERRGTFKPWNEVAKELLRGFPSPLPFPSNVYVPDDSLDAVASDLADSVGATAPESRAGYQRLYELIARRFGLPQAAQRTPEEQAAFDRDTQRWLDRVAMQGYRVTIHKTQ